MKFLTRMFKESLALRSLVRSRGFTLIELLVVLVIMSVLTLLFLINQGKFDSSTIMRSLAYQVALSVRQAQVYGTSVVQTTSGVSTFGPAYALAFDLSPGSPVPANYYIFGDSNTNNVYDTTPVPEPIVKKFSINASYTIQEVCAVGTDTGGAPVWRCNGSDDSSITPEINVLNIVFRRPNPDAQIQASLSGTSIVGDIYTTGYIQIQSKNNSDVRVIKVITTGQVTVCNVGNTSAPDSATNITIHNIEKTGAKC